LKPQNSPTWLNDIVADPAEAAPDWVAVYVEGAVSQDQWERCLQHPRFNTAARAMLFYLQYLRYIEPRPRVPGTPKAYTAIDRRIHEIAFDCGFASEAHFSRRSATPMASRPPPGVGRPSARRTATWRSKKIITPDGSLGSAPIETLR
jgi:AraC-like DNA-binding protein